MNETRKLLMERLYLNWADDSLKWTVRLTFTMTDDVDGDTLRQAIDATQHRYPYYSVSVRIKTDADGSEHYAYEDNPQPWVLSEGRQPVRLMGEESAGHLLAFAYWGKCFAIDFFHALTDGTGVFNLMRTLVYEYCRRRYNTSLEHVGIRTAESEIRPEEWDDLTGVPRPEHDRVLAPPEEQRAIDLSREAKTPVSAAKESVCISIDREQLMAYVHSHDTTPGTLVALLLARAIHRLHPDAGEYVPTPALAVNLRKVLGNADAPQSIANALDLPLTHELQAMPIEQQQTRYRQMMAEQTQAENIRGLFWSIADGQDQLEQYVPTLAARHQAMAQSTLHGRSMNSAVVSYTGRSNFGEAERYIRHLFVEGDSPLMLTIEMNDTAGQFCMNVEQQFASDLYLDAFLDEFRALGIRYRIIERHPLEVAPLADFRKKL